MEKTIKRFKKFSEKGYKHYTENTTEELDNLSLDNPDIITEFAHLCEWLRVNHGIWITVTSISQESWQWHITKPGDSLGKLYEEDFYSPQQAYSAAFDYILNNNLI
jgi:hypothetical protein